MIAMALLPRPDLIIADEPTTALDVTIQAQILRLLSELVKERGVSVLFTTHDLGTAYEICDRITVMYAGQEVEDGARRRVLRAPGPSLHPPAARQPARRGTGEIRDIAGEVPSLVGAAVGLPLPPALRRRDRGMPRRVGPRRARSPAITTCAATTPPTESEREHRHAAPLLEVVDLTRHFPVRNAFGRRTGSIRAVDGVSIAVRPGETLGLVGESGCGKSTLGKTVVGIHTPSAGDIRFAGREIGRLAKRRAARDRQAICSTSTRTPAPRSIRAGRSCRSLDEPLKIHTRAVSGRARRAGPRNPRRGRPARRPSGPLPARAVRRPAAPRRAGAHPDAAAAHGHPRRADLRPRRVRPGQRAQAVPRACKRPSRSPTSSSRTISPWCAPCASASP